MYLKRTFENQNGRPALDIPFKILNPILQIKKMDIKLTEMTKMPQNN